MLGGHTREVTVLHLRLYIEVEAVSLCPFDITIGHRDIQFIGVRCVSPQEHHHFSILSLPDQNHPLWLLWDGKYKHRSQKSLPDIQM